MVMAYDFNYPGSSHAGGVAPIDSPYVFDVRSALADWVRVMPGSKLIWGVPYYGRAWTTITSVVNGRTCFNSGTCTAASWAPRYIDALQAAATHGRRWDGTGQVPWYTHWSSTYGTHVQGYYDDATSLGVKYTLVKNAGLRGIGIWHLLMDGDRPELWNALAAHFVNPPFSDISGSAFLADIVWLADSGITTGCGGGRFCPTDPVARDQMASFLTRALDLPAATGDYFTDDAGNFHEAAINSVAEAGISIGCSDGLFCPTDPVRRDQMASFLARALALPDATEDFFTDDDGSDHEADINRVAAAGITLGCGDGTRFCPASLVSREQMAAFLHRALGS
jgi:glycosyl hydrolase family 18 (putative chitinase)/S-layer family protein